LYRGLWRDSDKRRKDPRQFVIEWDEEQDRYLVFWATSAFAGTFSEKLWPYLYRRRADLQENSFKSMIAHGALNTNYGTRVILGPDRHQQRKREGLEETLKKVDEREKKQHEAHAKQEEKVAESIKKGHGKWLESRKRKQAELKERMEKSAEKKSTLQTQLVALGEPKQRADRDFSVQDVMTLRTLLLENKLREFYEGVGVKEVGLKKFVELFMQRGGSLMETPRERVYWLDLEGLSASHKRTLLKIIERVNTLGLTHHGKPVQVRVRKGPT
jgi:hypothetical protein